MSTPIQEAIKQLTRGGHVEAALCAEVARQILEGGATPAQIGGFLVGMRMRGESAEQLTAFASVMREFATPVDAGDPDTLVDIVGTGGCADGMMNVSTCAAIVAAAAGARVAKHGNRAVTGTPGSGSADALEALGVNVECPPEVSARALRECGLAFFFAPAYHGAMRHAAVARREIGARSMLNLLGPLANPAGARRMVVGVSQPELRPVFAEALRSLGARRAMVVHGEDGLDEISLTAVTQVTELAGTGESREWTLDPRTLNLKLCAPEDLTGGDSPQERAEILRDVIGGREAGPRRTVVVLNAAAALLVAGKVHDIPAGLKLAAEVIDNGAARRTLERFTAVTNGETA